MQEKKQLMRNKAQQKIAGVCAGVADYLGWEHWVIRILAVTIFLFNASLGLIIYLVGWIVLNSQEKSHSIRVPSRFRPFESESAELNQGHPYTRSSFELKTHPWEKGVSAKDAVELLEQRFNEIDLQTQQIERYVTSPSYQIKQELKEL